MGREVDLACCSSLLEADAILPDEFGAQFHALAAPTPYPMSQNEVIRQDIRLLRANYLRGPNMWTYRPVLEVWLDLGELEDHPSHLLPGFNDRLTAALPKVRPGGLLIVDDADRVKYHAAMEATGWPRRDVVGFAPAKPSLAYTAVLTRP